MPKRIFLFSIGIPDPTQGGSGVINYLICRELLKKGFFVKAFFRVNEEFLMGHCQSNYLAELAGAGIEYQLIGEINYQKRFVFGHKLFCELQQYEVCKKAVQDLGGELDNFDAVIAFGDGWVLALKDVKPPTFCILGDPVQGRMRFGRKPSFLTPVFWKRWLQLQSLGTKSFYAWLKEALGEKNKLVLFSPYDAKLYQANNIDCSYFPIFTPEMEQKEYNLAPRKKLVGLHVATLQSTGSMNMLRYLTEKIFPKLSEMPFEIEIRFVGRAPQSCIDELNAAAKKNIKLVFLGHLESLNREFAGADFFFSPMKYPVGVRTRVVTAISYGMPVLADETVALGIPGLKHGYDILYASNAEEFVQFLQKAFQDPAWLAQIGKNARNSWEKFYEPQKNVARILEMLKLS